MITDVLVGGAGEDSARILRTVTKITTDTHDFDIREAFVDAKSQSNLGQEKITDPTENFEATVHSTHYRKYWDLGDIVNIKKETWKISQKQRITEVEEVIEKGKHNVTPVYGTPIAETFENEN